MLNKNTENVKNTNGTQMEKIHTFIKKIFLLISQELIFTAIPNNFSKSYKKKRPCFGKATILLICCK